MSQKRKKPLKTVLIPLGAILVASILGTFFYLRWTGFKKQINTAISSKAEPARQALKPIELPTDPINILVIGNDARSELGSATQGRADTIMVVRLDPFVKKAYLISIPRDTYAKIPGHGRDKINAAYAWGGEQLLIQSVSALLDMPIHHFVAVDFQGFAKLVDTLGGVDVYIDEPLIDPKSGANFTVGKHHLNGQEALAYVRTRATPTADFGRIHRQQRFLKAMMEQHLSLSLIYRAPELFNLVKEYVTTDLDVDTIMKYAAFVREIGPQNVQMSIIPTKSQVMNGIWYEMPNYDEILKLLEQVKQGHPPDRYGAEYTDNETIPRIALTFQKLKGKMRVRNTGFDSWTTYGHVTNLSYHLYDYVTGKEIQFDGPRFPLPKDEIKPGEEAIFDVEIIAPDHPGVYRYCFDMVTEGLLWFSAARVPVYNVIVEVRNPALYSEANSAVHIELQNGSQDEEAFDAAYRMLRSYGFNVTKDGDFALSPIYNSKIVCREQDYELAKQVASVLNGYEPTVEGEQLLKFKQGVDIIVVVGKDFLGKEW